MELKPSRYFLEQLDGLSDKTLSIVDSKLKLIEANPFRFKRLYFPGLQLFRIPINDRNKELRLIYLVENKLVTLLFFLYRKNDYSELRKKLKLLGYL